MARRKARKNPLNLINKVKKRRAKKAAASTTSNPPLKEDFLETILPGLGSYAITRIAARVAYNMSKKKNAKIARHAAPVAAVATAAAAWYGANKIAAKDYHDGIILGSSIAAAQTVIQHYIPQYGWILDDVHMEAITNGKAGNAAALPESTDGIAPQMLLGTADNNTSPASTEPLIDDIVGAEYAGSLG
jgi:hypothetical protein